MEEQQTEKGIDRRNFIRVAGAGLTAAGVALTPAERAIAQFKTDKDRFERIASAPRGRSRARCAAFAS